MTLLLSQSQLQEAVDAAELAAELRRALADYREDEVAHRVGARLGTLTAMVLVPGLAAGVPAYTVKVHAKNPQRRPAINGVICLHDLASGALLAVMESGWLTALRTGIGAAVGTDVLARPDAQHVGVIGAGAQGRAQLSALGRFRRIDSVAVFDPDQQAAVAFREEMEASLGVEVRPVSSPALAAESSDIVLVATWATDPVLLAEHVRRGTQVTSLGGDEPGKQELDPRLLAEAVTVVDDRRLPGALAAPVIDATLSEVMRGDHPGRAAPTDITVYSPVGLPMQDCLSAWHAYCRAVDLAIGTEIDFRA